MGFKCGIVGLPNVGKSTLFNALTSTAAAEAANYPFCTIEPNIGLVGVPDVRLDKLAETAGSAKVIPNQIEFVDIAGLVKGASQGEGLGNKFLSHIREVDVIAYVLRCFEDDDITHVEESIDPMRDFEIIETELVIADMESLEKRIPNLEKKVRSRDKDAIEQLDLVKRILPVLEAGNPARELDVTEDEERPLRLLQLLTSKKVMFICNMSESEVVDGNKLSTKVEALAKVHGAECTRISAKIEEEISILESDEEKVEFLGALGLEETGLSQIIRAGYALLGQLTFFTVGPKEAHAWNLDVDKKAPQAAGVIHTDFERGFICAETVSCDDFIEFKGESGAKEAGKMRQEGKEYVVKDGDVFHFRFNV
jgi:GTP-binding protein YchF